jgi:glycolate oxidase subunit GlcD
MTLTTAQRAFLEGLFPGDQALFSAEETLVYGMDASRLSAPPLAVVRPVNPEQVRELLAWAETEKMPIYPRASATNVVGGCVPVKPGVVVSCLGLGRILDLSEEDFVAEVEPGVVLGELQRELTGRRLFYPPDPASLKVCTVGGSVSTCAGGLKAVKYGVTRDYVLGLDAVLPGGRVLSTGGRAHKNVVGLDLTRLLVGSAGTLAFFTKLILKLLPQPEATATVLSCFPSLDAALVAARGVFRAGILPVALELMDEGVLRALANLRDVPWPKDSRAALLIRLDGPRQGLGLEIKRLQESLTQASPTFQSVGIGPENEEELWDIRRLINPAAFTVGPNKAADDIALPRGRVGRALSAIQEVSREVGLPILCFGHLGDGNVHVNTMYDAQKPGDPERMAQAKARILDLTLSLGGTVSGEHGTGLVKAAYAARQLKPVERELMHAVKAAFDPSGIMNPGKELF